MRKIKDFQLFDSEPLVMGNRIKPLNPFIEFKKEDIQQSIARRFEQQVERYPDNIAVKTVNKVLTYGRLNSIANQIAHTISCSLEYEGECGAALLFEHDADMIPGILGALKAGKFYIPMDPTYPPERLAYILEDSRAKILITNKNNRTLAHQLDKFTGSRMILIDIDTLAPGVGEENPHLDIDPGNLAYILYTSGSTGKPKGVIQNQRNVLHFARVYTNALHINSHDRLTQFSSYGFDAAKMDIFGALLNGAGLYPLVIKQEGSLDRLAQWLKSEKITIFHSIPTVYRYFVDTLTSEDTIQDLRFIVLGGEAVYRRDVEKYKKFFSPACLFVNGLGPTESTVTVQYFVNKETEITREAVPVGYAVEETRLYLVNQDNREARPYEIGEIVFKSDYLALGYLNNIEKTHEGFGLDLLTGEGRVYRTGDMGRSLPDGAIEYVGRNDSQVKVNGFRIELGEIEGNLDNIDGMKKSVVVCKQDRSGENYLAAYYIKNEDPDLDANVLIKKLREKLPDFLIPRVFIQLKEFPLTLTGKIDRNALPDSEAGEGKAFIPPANELGEKVIEIWAEVLGLEKQEISMNSNFFEIGGQSFKAVILAAKIQKEFDVSMPLQDLFELSTAGDMAAYLEKNTAEDTFIPIEPVEEKEYYPLSSAQKRLYIMYRMDERNTRYNVSSAVVLKGSLQPQRLRDIFKKLIKRHESLRTSFNTVRDEPVQQIHQVEDVTFAVRYNEKGDIEPGEGVKQLITPFDLEKAPLLRVGLIKAAEHEHILMIDMHHIISDGTSLGILAGEFMSLYSSGDGDGKVTGLPALKVRYKDYSGWRSSDKEKAGILKQKKYWQEQFEDDVPVLHLPVDYPRPVVQRFEGSKVFFEIPPEQTAALKKIALQQEATLYMTLLALYTIFLAKISGSKDIVVGTPTAGRRHTDLEPIIGMFVNTLCIKNSPNEEDTFNTFLQQEKATTLAAFENQDYPFEELVENVEVNRDTSRNPLFDVMFVLQNLDMPVIQIPGLQLKPYPAENNTAKFDMTFQAFEEVDKLKFTVEYSTNLFREETIKRLVTYFKKVVVSVLEPRQKKIADIEIITAEEKRQVLYDFNDTRVRYQEHKTLQQLFAEQVERTPDHIAVIGTRLPSLSGRGSLTYRQLNESSGQLARILRQRGAAGDIIVGIMMERSLEMLTGIMAILKAGGAYLPIDPDYPQERIDYMLKDSGAQVLVVDDTSCASWLSFAPKALLNLSEGHHLNFPASQLPSFPASLPSSLAYVTYTSGSTGKPKGVMIEHRPVVNFIKGIREVIPFGEKDCILSLTTITFDIFGLETLLPLTAGSTVVMGTRQQQSEAAAAARVIQEENITIFQVTPSRLQLLLAHPQACAALKLLGWLLVGGETLPAPLLEKAKQFITGKIYNLYGPTETTIWSTLKDVTGENALNIGKPTANTQIYIVSQSDHLQPVGIPGELLIGGHGVARGYLNNPELTTERFCLRRPGGRFLKKLPPWTPRKNFLLKGSHNDHMQSCNHPSGQLSPYHSPQYPNTPLPHHPIYLTGDLARWLPDGNIEFFARMDQQVKIRGFRIEPGEIENRILEMKAVKEAVVIIKEINGDKHLCAYIVPAAKQGPGSGELSGNPGSVELRDHLSTVLPGYMIPSFFIFLERIPLTPSGKVNRKLLPEPQLEAGGEYTAPRDKQEQDLVELWSLVLGTAKESIGIDTNFFRLGGHSLKAMILASHIHKTFNVRVPLPIMFNKPTIRGLSGYIKASAPETYVPLENVEQKDYYELSYHQGRLWFIYQVDPLSSSYNMPGRITFNDKVKAEAVKKALYRIIQRHDSLRTGFRIVDTGPVQFIKEEIDIPFEHIDIVSLSPDIEERKKKKEAIINQLLTTPFVLENPPLFRSALLEGDAEYEFIFNVHHIVFDGWSMAIVKKEFLALVDAYSRNAREPALPPLEGRYRDFARWQNQRTANPEVRERNHRYWLKKLEQGLPESNLPTDLNPVSRTGETAAYVFVLEEDIKDRLMQMAANKNISLFMVMFSALNLLLARITGQQDIMTGIAAAGREHAALQPIVGFFVSSIIFISHVNPDGPFADFLDRMEKNTLEVLQNQDYPFELVIENLKMRFPKIPVMFNMLNMGDGYEPGVETLSHPREPYHIETVQDVKFQQELYVSQYKNAIEIQVHYRKALFKPATIEYMMGEYKKLLDFIMENPLETLNDYGKSSNKQKFSRRPKPGKC